MQWKVVGALALVIWACGESGPRPPERDRTLGDFVVAALGAPADSFTVADFNDQGHVAGTVHYADGRRRPFRHLGAGFEILLENDTTRALGAAALNDSGDVAVNYGPRWTAAIWRRSRRVLDSIPASLRSQSSNMSAVDIDNSGAVLLVSFQGTVPVVWNGSTVDTIGTPVNTLGTYFPTGVFLNNAGLVVLSICDLLRKFCSWRAQTDLSPSPAYAALEDCPFGDKYEDRTPPFVVHKPRALTEDGTLLVRVNGTNCVYRPGEAVRVVPYDRLEPSINRDLWMVGDDDGPILVANGKPYRPFDLLPSADGWTIDRFVRVNDNAQILALGRKDGETSILVLSRNQ